MYKRQATVILDENGVAPAIDFSQVDAGSFDNCEIDSISFNSGSFTCDDIGVQNIPVTIFDGNGNSTTEAASIVVLEEIAPQIDCSQSSVVTNSCEPVFYPVPLATDNCSLAFVELIDGLASGSVFNPGVSTVTYRATDDCGNTSDCSFTITINNDLAFTANILEASCFDGDGSITINAIGGTPPYMIEPFASADNLAAGGYNFTITDSLGCTIEELIILGQMPNNITASITTTAVSCAGSSDGSVEVVATGGTGNLVITGPTTGLSVGENSITITDENGCAITETFIIDEPEPILVDITATPVSCAGASDGSVQVISSGGTGNLVVTGATTGLSGGDQTITISDENGCTITETFTIDEPEPILINVSVDPDPCTGEFMSSLVVTVIGGNGSFIIDTIVVDNLLTINVVDAKNCSASEEIELMIPAPLDVVLSNINADDGTSSGGLSVAINGGVGPFEITWTDEDGVVIGNDTTLSDLAAGTYIVTILDACGNETAVSFTIPLQTATLDLDKENNVATVFPSPVSNLLQVKFNDDVAQSIIVMDMNGKILLDVDRLNQQTELDVKDLSSGVYLMQLIFDETTYVKTFMKL